MKVTVFGATGGIGRLVVLDLLQRGDEVTGFVRSPGKVPESWAGRVHLVVGELDDRAAVECAIEGADAVISALGPSMKRSARGLPLVEGTRTIIDSMKALGVKRFVGHATPSILDSREKPSLQTRLVSFMGRTMLPRAYEELQGMSRIIRGSDLDWTIVRFTAPQDGAAKGHVRAGFYGTDRIGFAVTRADIAVFTVAQLRDPTFVTAVPAISN